MQKQFGGIQKMRKKHEEQLMLTFLIPDNKLGKELQAISKILDANRHILNMVHNDLTTAKKKKTGRRGLNADQVLRCALLKQHQCLSYEDLEFYISDSTSFHAFARIGNSKCPKKSTLQDNIKAISAETWEYINRTLVDYSLQNNIEKANMARTDSTAVDTNIHYPTDSTLLQDGIRILTRSLARGKDLNPKPVYTFSDHQRAAKRKVLNIKNKPKKRNKAYKDLLKLAAKVVGYVEAAIPLLALYEGNDAESSVQARMLADKLEYDKAIMLRVIEQTKRRVIHGESVPAEEKVVSFFECHTDIINKGNRDTQFGHKVFLTTAKSGLVLDCLIERGNPSDAGTFKELLNRQQEILGKMPRQMAADGGFASKENLEEAQEEGVQDMVFAKKRGLKILDMAKSEWVYKKLRNFRAGIEGLISVLKRAFGLDRCTWSDWEGFKQYVWSCVVTFNLQVIARS